MRKLLGRMSHIHFVGIGGIGMSGLALIYHNLGFKISGSDIKHSAVIEALKKAGMKVKLSHAKENVRNADVVVYSTAIKDDNCEIIEAKRLGIPVIHRSELLAELTRIKNSICVSGTHGKTTTSSLIGEVLEKGGLKPTTIIGGIVKDKSQAWYGLGDYLVCEADESDKSFLRLLPAYAIITNIEPEHLDFYKDLREIEDNFTYFANHVPFWGCVFLGADSPSNLNIKDRIKRRVILYGLNEIAHLRAEKIERVDFGSRFKVYWHNKDLGVFKINLPGRHNVINSLAAIGVGLELEVKLKNIKDALENFKGVQRRIEYRGTVNEIMIFEDYGHHPTEISVTLQTLREYFPQRRIISIFQPHRYTRTYYLFNDFGRAFIFANVVILTEIYSAHEIPIPGINGEALARRISKEQENVFFAPTFDEVIKRVKKIVAPGDLIVVQGAGDINRIITPLFEVLK
ncbi:MAG: UDP-N-acetylmuramate--L-alanine ligase [candidate division WOR-3 bacterium]|nr:UDP-N-acetylmuramate--L-alanine ligase [candidate division WOR-3 bacterium]